MAITRNGAEYKVADAHTHIYPHKIADKATAAVGAFYGLPMELVGSSEELKASGGAAGIDRYLVCSVATKHEQVSSINDFIAEECRQHPEFVGFGAFHQDLPDFDKAIESIITHGFRGIKMHPDFQRFNIDAPEMMPAYKAIAEAGLIILFHMGDDRYDYSRPSRLIRVLDKIPELKCIAAHFGGYRKWHDAFPILRDADVHLDTSSSLAFIEPEFAADMVRGYGVDKMMFGTDFPMWTPELELDRFFALGLTEDENRKVLFDNFENLLLK